MRRIGDFRSRKARSATIAAISLATTATGIRLVDTNNRPVAATLSRMVCSSSREVCEDR